MYIIQYVCPVYCALDVACELQQCITVRSVWTIITSVDHYHQCGCSSIVLDPSLCFVQCSCSNRILVCEHFTVGCGVCHLEVCVACGDTRTPSSSTEHHINQHHPHPLSCTQPLRCWACRTSQLVLLVKCYAGLFVLQLVQAGVPVAPMCIQCLLLKWMETQEDKVLTVCTSTIVWFYSTDCVAIDLIVCIEGVSNCVHVVVLCTW